MNHGPWVAAESMSRFHHLFCHGHRRDTTFSMGGSQYPLHGPLDFPNAGRLDAGQVVSKPWIGDGHGGRFEQAEHEGQSKLPIGTREIDHQSAGNSGEELRGELGKRGHGNQGGEDDRYVRLQEFVKDANEGALGDGMFGHEVHIIETKPAGPRKTSRPFPGTILPFRLGNGRAETPGGKANDSPFRRQLVGNTVQDVGLPRPTIANE